MSKLGIPYTPRDGFGAQLVLGEDGQYYLAFRATNPTSTKDWRTNAKQALAGSTSQYRQAVSLAKAVTMELGGNVVFVGTSLGGGLAAAAAFATGGRAITFNAAGLHPYYRSGTKPDIRAHYIRGDILSTLQWMTPLPNAAGRQIGHAAAWYKNPVARHGLDEFP